MTASVREVSRLEPLASAAEAGNQKTPRAPPGTTSFGPTTVHGTWYASVSVGPVVPPALAPPTPPPPPPPQVASAGLESSARENTIAAIVAGRKKRVGFIGILRIVRVRGGGSIAVTRRPGLNP
jgi:hypothetical protein